MIKKILITGGAGFIGGNFILKQIHNTQNEILNYDNLSYAGNPDTLKDIRKNKRYHFVKGNIEDSSLLSKTISEFMPDFIVNFAAQSHVDRSINAPLDFIQTNILGTAILLESIRKYLSLNSKLVSSFKFLHVSTDEVYGSLGADGFFIEESRYDPSSPYSASKASSDHLVRAWNKTFNIPILITNCSNNYGPYQFPEKLVPLTILNCFYEKSLPIYGEGKNVRDWLYVEDHCDAIYSVLENGKLGDTYNIGGNNEVQNICIVNKICEIMDELKPRDDNRKYSDLITYVQDRPGHDFRYAIDASKIKNELGWEPKESFDSGIRKTVIWYLSNKQWWNKIKTSYNH